MGQANSVLIFLRLEGEYFFAGEIVKGIIELQKKNHLAIPITNLRLRLKGTESYKKAHRVQIYSHQVVVAEDFVLESEDYWKDFKFQFSLSPQIPGSYESKGLAKIKYTLTAEANAGNNVLRVKVPLKVREQLKMYQGVKEYSYQTKMTQCYCYDSGQIKLQCKINKHTFLIGDTAELDIRVDASKLKADAMEIVLELVSCCLVQLPEEQKMEQKVHKTVIASEWKNEKLQTQIDPLPVKFKLEGANGEVLQPSSSGNLVQFEYYLAVYCRIGGGLFGSASKLLIPIKLFGLIVKGDLRENENISQSIITNQNQMGQAFLIKCGIQPKQDLIIKLNLETKYRSLECGECGQGSGIHQMNRQME